MNDRMAAYNARRAIAEEKTFERKKRSHRGVHPLFREKVNAEDRCRNPRCGRTRYNHAMERHHIVHRSALMGMDWTIRDHPDNGMLLCKDCHAAHHRNEADFDRSMLSEAEIAFVLRYAGRVWLDKHFPIRKRDDG